MQHGHAVGTKKERTGASDWYKAIEDAALSPQGATPCMSA